jgi:hypothetical protein
MAVMLTHAYRFAYHVAERRRMGASVLSPAATSRGTS